MKPYTVSVEVDLPRERFLELYLDPANLPRWQTGLQSIEPLGGEPGHEGAQTKLVFQNGKRRIELVETITKRALPDEIHGLYEWAGGQNTLVNRFMAIGPATTRWESTCAYDLTHVMLKVMGAVAPGMFRRQNQKFLDNFKAFAEGQGA